MSDAQLTATLRRLALTVAPELRAGPLYIVLKSDGPPAGLIAEGAYGLSGSHLDLALRPWLESRGQWQGRGPAIYVDGDSFPAGFSAAGIVLHELAHALGNFSLPAADECDVATAAAVCTSSAGLWRSDLPKTLPPWLAHEAPFLRAALHLHWRAERAGYHVPRSFVFRGADYGLSSEDQYAAALGTELSRLALATIAEIGQTQPPAEFVSLWRSDVRAWYMANPSAGDLAVHCVVTDLHLYTPGDETQ